MEFKQETGAIISSSGLSLAYFDGSQGHVDFDIELLAKIHKASPGIIWKFAHTHPLRMTEASGQDRLMLKTLAPMLYPFPVRLSVITSLSREYADWQEITYIATLQSKEEWKASKKQFREITIIEEKVEKIFPYGNREDFSGWQRTLLGRSYEL